MAKYTDAERQEAREWLLRILAPGDTVWTVLRHVSRNGMSRRIDLYVFRPRSDRPVRNPVKFYLSGYVATLLSYRRHTNDGIVVGGCGMDMGFHLVYNLSHMLWPDGFECIGRGCPSNDHSNGDRDYEPHHHQSGGYALNHEWI